MEQIFNGLQAALQLQPILIIAFGILVGILVGAAPGLGPTAGMAVLLPFTLGLTAETAVFLLVSVAVGATFGNSIPSVLLNVPGSPSAVLTALAGNPLHRRGEGQRALLICLQASVVGQFFGVLLFAFAVIPLSRFGVRLLFPEVFAIVVLGLLTSAGLFGRSKSRGIAAVLIGLTLSLSGFDAVSGMPKLTFGRTELMTGLPVIPVVIGMLAFPQVFHQFASLPSSKAETVTDIKRSRLSLPKFRADDSRAIILPIFVGAVVGLLIGAVPGAGASVGTFITYQVYRSVSSVGRAETANMEKEGSIRGLAAIDSAANSSGAGELIPTFGLGIPGSAAMVIVMAALSAQGLVVGPQLLQANPTLIYATFGGLIVATLLLGIIGYFMIIPSVFIADLNPSATNAATIVLILIGVFALRWRLFDLWVVLGAGVLGWLMVERGYPIAPAALGVILGPVLEKNLRAGLIMTGSTEAFFTRPLVATLLSSALVGLIASRFIQRGVATPAMMD